MILSSSCNNDQPKEFTGEQCTNTMVEVDIAGKRYVDVEASKCECRKYKVSKEFIGPLGKFERKDLLHCNLHFGYRPTEYAALRNLMEHVRVLINTSKDQRIIELGYR